MPRTRRGRRGRRPRGSPRNATAPGRQGWAALGDRRSTAPRQGRAGRDDRMRPVTVPVSIRRALALFAVLGGVLLAPAAALAQSATPSPAAGLRTPEETAQDQIILSGSANVPRGTTAGE